MSLSTEQEEKVTLFQEVTAESSRDVAIRHLEMSNWEVENAVNLKMTGGLDGTSTSMNPSTSPQPPPQMAGQQDQLIGGIGANPTAARGAREQQSTGGHIFERIFNAIGRVFGAAANFLVGEDPASASGIGNAADFKTRYERQYGTTHPAFYDGNYSSSVVNAKDNIKMLCVYFHCETAAETDNFCKNVLNSDLVMSILRENYVTWAGDITHRAIYDLARTFNVRSYPFMAVVLPSGSTTYQVLHKVEGTTTLDSVVAMLTAGVESLNQNRDQLAAQNMQQTEDRLLREEQDREYQEALEKDRERERQEAIAAEERRKVEAEAAEEERKKQDEFEMLQSSRKLIASSLPMTADLKAGQPTSRVQLKFPSGAKTQRAFKAEDPITLLFDWVEALEYLEDAGVQVTIPKSYTLSTSFPTKKLDRNSGETFKEAGLCPSAQVMLQSHDEDE